MNIVSAALRVPGGPHLICANLFLRSSQTCTMHTHHTTCKICVDSSHNHVIQGLRMCMCDVLCFWKVLIMCMQCFVMCMSYMMCHLFLSVCVSTILTELLFISMKPCCCNTVTCDVILLIAQCFGRCLLIHVAV